MGDFHDAIKMATPEWYSRFGVAATYTPLGGSPASVTIIKTEEFDSEEKTGSIRHDGEVSVQISEVAARPNYRDTFIVTDGEENNQTWTVVDGGVSEIGDEWVCKVARSERPVL